MAYIRSERRTTFSGQEYVAHYNERGELIATSEERTPLLGDPYIQHIDKHGRNIGTSLKRNPLLGDTYYEHFDKNGRSIGTSHERHPLIGKEYTIHYGNSGKSIGTSETVEPMIGSSFVRTDTNFTGSSSGLTSSPSPKSDGGVNIFGIPYSPDFSNYASSSRPSFCIDMVSSILENLMTVVFTGLIMLFLTDYLINIYYTNQTLFYQAVSLYACVSPIICLLVMHKKFESKGAGKTAIWMMAAASTALIISETQLFEAIIYPGSIYHFMDFVRTIRFWIPLAIYGFILGLITVLSLRKTEEDQKLYIRKMSNGFRTHAICSYSAIYAAVIHMGDRLLGDTTGWFSLILNEVFLIIFISVLTSIAIFVSNIPYVIFCKYPKK